MLNENTIAFIGSGAMGEAMIKGLLRQGLVEPAQIIASGPRPERGQELFERYGVPTTTDNVEAATGADVSEADPDEFGMSRESDLTIIRIGEECCEIPDAVISGG